MTGREHDDEFEAYLKRRVPIHERLSSLERLEPPEELDRLVIGRARQAIQGPSQVRVFRAPKWALPVGLAATIVISFTLLLNVGVHKAKTPEAPVIQTEIVAPPPMNATMAAPAAAPAETDSAVTSAARATRAKAPRSSREIVASRNMAKKSADIPVEVQSTAIVDTTDKHVSAPPPPASAGSALRADVPTAGVDRLAEDKAVPAAPVAEPAPPAVAGRQGESMPGAPTTLQPPAQMTATPLQSVTVTTPLAPAPRALARARPDAATWFAQIEKLRAEGKTIEAEREFKRFRDVYPHYVPPESAPPADGRTK